MKSPSPGMDVVGLLGWLLVSSAAALIGAIASLDAASFYSELSRPDWAPPGWLFAPVWSVLYVLMGVSAWLVWREGGFLANRAPLLLFIIQLAANALWTWLFFAWRQGAGAFAEILILWALILATIAMFRHRSVVAALLLVPYLAWVTFATALTYSVWHRNTAVL